MAREGTYLDLLLVIVSIGVFTCDQLFKGWIGWITLSSLSNIYKSFFLFLYLFPYLSIYLFISLFIYLFIYLYLYIQLSPRITKCKAKIQKGVAIVDYMC